MKYLATTPLVLLFSFFSLSLSAQWLEFSDETAERLILTSVANADDEEKDFAQADLNRDGWTDVIVVRKEPFSLSTEGPKSDLLLMNVNGQLVDQTALYAPEFISNATFARDLYIGDLDNDNWPDVVVANTFGQQPIYYHNLGKDENGNWLGFADETATCFPALIEDELLFCAVWAGDVTGDGSPDLYFNNYKAVQQGAPAKDYLLINDGSGVFTNESEARLGELRNSAFGTSVQIHDMDNDGDQDIIKISTLYGVPPWNGNAVAVLFNSGNGFYENWQVLPTFAPYMIEIADFDDNGYLDVFIVSDNDDYLFKTTGAIADSMLIGSPFFYGPNGFGGNVHAADLDLDGDLDIAVADVDVDIPPCNSNRLFTILENQDGDFVPGYAGLQDWSGNCYDFSFLDVNKDGLMDFLKGGCDGYELFMSDNCELVTSSADFDLDGLADACDECPTNPDPNCSPAPDYPTVSTDHSIARQWNELLLASIRRDFARPTVHARNLFHTSVTMWDAWAVYDDCATTYMLGKTLDNFSCPLDSFPQPQDIEAARHEAISYAAYRLLSHRFSNSPQAETLQQAYDVHMDSLGYDINFNNIDYRTGSAAAMGNYIAQCMIAYGLQDGSNEQGLYTNLYYEPSNPPLIVELPGNPDINDLNRWQPLTLDLFIDQSGNPIPGDTPDFLSPEWGLVKPFALDSSDLTTYNRDGDDYWVYHDPGAPPYHAMDGTGGTEDYRWTFTTTLIWSSHLDPNDGVMWDISPNSIGDRSNLPTDIADYPNFYNYLDGGTVSNGHEVNPATGEAYDINMVPRADYARVLAEFWADGPDSETPPGHWFSILNYVSDHPDLVKKYQGSGPELDELEWDVKAYFSLGGAMHDAAISAWGIKGWYDYIRPISAIRAMAELGQSSIDSLDNYHPGGLPLIEGYIEIVMPGDPLAGVNNSNLGKIKAKAWKGHTAIDNPDTDEAGVDWILVDNWEPYQRPSFVSPPFAGFISGHSTYSRAAAEVLTAFTGDAYFPGGVGTFLAEKDEFLVFEDGPSVDVELQWATYRDAADESGLSRIWGGIHPPADDIPGRHIGIEVGLDAFAKADFYFEGAPQMLVKLEDATITDDISYDLGPVKIGQTSSSGEFTLYNEGQTALVFTGDPVIQISGQDAAQFSVDLTDFPASLGPLDSVSFRVDYTPSEELIQIADISIATNDCRDDQFDFQVTGRGIRPSLDLSLVGETALTLSPGDSLDMPITEQDSTSIAVRLAMENEGEAELVFLNDPIIQLTGPDADAFLIDQANVPNLLASSASAEFDIRFAPTRIGFYEAFLNISSDDPDNPNYQIYLSSLGIAPEIDLAIGQDSVANGALIEFNATEVDSSSLNQIITILNRGEADLEFTSDPIINLTGDHPNDFILDIAALTNILISNEQVDFGIVFSPQDTGMRQAELVIASTDRDEPIFNLILEGRGLRPEIGISSEGIEYDNPDSFDFGNVFMDSIAGPQVFTIRNDGTAPLRFSNNPIVEVDNPAFILEQINLPNQLGVGESADFSLSFNPTALEIYTATMSIASSDRDDPIFVIELLGTGVMLPNSSNEPGQDEDQLTLYPNPSQDEIFVQQASRVWQNSPYQIYNGQGQLVQTGRLNGVGRISVNELADGAYLVVVPTSNSLLRARFVKL